MYKKICIKYNKIIDIPQISLILVIWLYFERYFWKNNLSFQKSKYRQYNTFIYDVTRSANIDAFREKLRHMQMVNFVMKQLNKPSQIFSKHNFHTSAPKSSVKT